MDYDPKKLKALKEVLGDQLFGQVMLDATRKEQTAQELGLRTKEANAGDLDLGDQLIALGIELKAAKQADDADSGNAQAPAAQSTKADDMSEEEEDGEKGKMVARKMGDMSETEFKAMMAKMMGNQSSKEASTDVATKATADAAFDAATAQTSRVGNLEATVKMHGEHLQKIGGLLQTVVASLKELKGEVPPGAANRPTQDSSNVLEGANATALKNESPVPPSQPGATPAETGASLLNFVVPGLNNGVPTR